MIARLNLGGPARCVIHLAEGLAGRGFETRVCTGAPGPGEGEMAAPGIAVERIPGLQRALNPLKDLQAYFSLRKLIAAYKPHLVHTHTAKAGFLGRMAALHIARPPVLVHTYHGHVLDHYFGPVKSSLFRTLEQRLAMRTQALIAVSASVRDELLQLHGVGRAADFSVIPSGSPQLQANQNGDLREALGLGRGPVAGVIARMVPIKGYRLLMQAIPAITRQVPDLKFLIIGDGPDRARLEAWAARKPWQGRVILAGARQDREKIFNTLDFLILPSLKEGLPTVLLEAATAGCPVAASRIAGVQELAEHNQNALLFDPRSPTDLCRAVVRLALDEKLRCCLAERARETVPGRVPSYDEVAEAHARLYRQLMEQRAE